MARRPRASNETLIELFLDMLAAERGAGGQHARRLSARPRRFLRAISSRSCVPSRPPTPTTCAPISGGLGARLQGLVGGAAAVGDPPALSLPLRRRPSRRTIRPPCWKGPSAAGPAENPVGRPRSSGLLRDRAGGAWRREARRRSNGCAPRASPACSRCSTRPACACPNWWRCRRRRRGASPHAGGARQGRQGSAWCRSTTPPSAP